MPSPYDAARVFFHETNWFQFNFDDRAIQLSKYGVELNLQKIPKHKFSIRWTDMSAICEQHVFWYIPRRSEHRSTLLQYMNDELEPL